MAVLGADALAICTEWKEFRTADFAWLKQQLVLPVVVDGRNLFEPALMQQAGLLTSSSISAVATWLAY